MKHWEQLLSHTCTTIATYAISRFTFATFIRNNCNIPLEHLKHLKHMLVTCDISRCAWPPLPSASSGMSARAALVSRWWPKKWSPRVGAAEQEQQQRRSSGRRGLSNGGGGSRFMGKERKGRPWTMDRRWPSMAKHRGGLSSHFLIRPTQRKGQTQAA
jgi:hypothetical protein